MKRILFFFLLFSVTIANAQRKFDVLHYSFGIELNDLNDSIQGIASVKLKFLQASDEVELDLTNINLGGKGMKVTSIKGDEVWGLEHISNKVRFHLSKTYKAGEEAAISILYAGIPADGLIISKNKFGNRTFFSDNWPNRAHNWIPCIDDPGDKATVDFMITAPSHYQVISNGLQIEETNLPVNKKLTVWREDMPIPTKVMVIGAADFAVNLAGIVNGCIPVTSWVFPENKVEGFSDYAEATVILNWLSNYIGPYPYKKLANIQSKTIFGGMENASAIFYFENTVTGKGDMESLLAHEIVHQWFGNTATEKSFAHLWLSEGFASYLTHVYLESKYGKDSLNKRMQNDRNDVISFVKGSNLPVVDNTTNYMTLLNANSYQKGSWVLHMLRRQLGDSVFRQSIRTYYSEFAWKNATTADLEKIFERVSKKDLSGFFNQWLTRPVNPTLNISWKWLASEQIISVTIDQLQGSLFSFPFEIGTGSKVEKIQVTKKSETFRFKATAKPAVLIPDPNTSLLFEGVVHEVK